MHARRLVSASVLGFAGAAALAGFLALVSSTPAQAVTGIRFCCTPQQVQACAAKGGTATCRTGVCQCLF